MRVSLRNLTGEKRCLSAYMKLETKENAGLVGHILPQSFSQTEFA